MAKRISKEEYANYKTNEWFAMEAVAHGKVEAPAKVRKEAVKYLAKQEAKTAKYLKKHDPKKHANNLRKKAKYYDSLAAGNKSKKSAE